MWQRWLQNWWSLLSTPQIYYQVSRWPWRKVSCYAGIAFVILGLGSAWYFNQVEIPQAEISLQQARQEFQTHFPSGLQLSWTGTELRSSTSSALPVYYPSFIRPLQWQLPERLAYYTPLNNPPAQLQEELPSSALAIVTPTQLYLTDFQGSWSKLELSTLLLNTPPQEINQTTLPGILDRLENSAREALHVAAKLSFVLFPLSVIATRSLTALIDGLLAYLLLKIQNYRFTYGQVAKISFLIAAIASAAEFIAQLLYRDSAFPVFGIIYWGYWFLIILAGRWHILQLRRQS